MKHNKTTIYQYLNEPEVYSVLIQLVRNRVINSTAIVEQMNMYETYLEMEGLEKEKWDRLSKNYDVSVSTVKRILTFFKKEAKK